MYVCMDYINLIDFVCILYGFSHIAYLITLFLPVTVCRYPPYKQFKLNVSMYGGDEVPAGPSVNALLLS